MVQYAQQEVLVRLLLSVCADRRTAVRERRENITVVHSQV